MTTIHLNSGEATDLLIAHLREQGQFAVEHVGINTIRVSLLGSYSADAMRLAIYLRLRAWEAAERAQGNDVRLVFEDPS